MSVPNIAPIQVKEYVVKQSKYAHMQKSGTLPVRGIILAPSSGGKTTLIASLLTDVYDKAFSRVYIFSPTCKPGLDGTWDAVRKYVYGPMGTPEDEQCFFHEFDPAKLAEIIAQAEAVTMHLKKKGAKTMFNIAIILDDWADQPEVYKGKHGSLLQTLAISGRHRYISTWYSTQGYRLLHSSIRNNCTHNYVFRLRNAGDIKAWVEENAGAYDEKTMMKLYKYAVDYEPYSFPYADLTATDVSEMFMHKFTTYLVPQ